MNGDPEGKDCDSSWLSQISGHTERLQTAPREGEEFNFASLKTHNYMLLNLNAAHFPREVSHRYRC